MERSRLFESLVYLPSKVIYARSSHFRLFIAHQTLFARFIHRKGIEINRSRKEQVSLSHTKISVTGQSTSTNTLEHLCTALSNTPFPIPTRRSRHPYFFDTIIMSQSATKDEDGSEYPFARDAANSGRAIEVTSPVERAHPYNRRPSLPMLDGGPRIHLPILGHEGPSRPDAPRVLSGHSQPVNIPGISSLDMRDGPWQRSADRERYWEDRSRQSERPGDERIPMSRTASTGHAPQVRLPSFHSLSSSEPHNGEQLGFGPGSSVMPPPPRPRTNPPSPRFAYARATSPHLPAAHSLRPSYSSQSRPLEGREMHDYPPVKRENSPPLRSIHTYESPGYPPSSAGHYHQASDGRHPAYHHGHQQHHPAPFTNRAQHHPSYADPSRRQEEERPTGPGQSRRLAHLMSEQKRRE